MIVYEQFDSSTIFGTEEALPSENYSDEPRDDIRIIQNQKRKAAHDLLLPRLINGEIPV
ncbi:MAG: hypothetical protein NG747_07770 [Candidatus Brocadia sp.]|nr:hypothetical protein [Candidatus Brocadia sp.]